VTSCRRHGQRDRHAHQQRQRAVDHHQNGITLPTGTPFSITGVTSSTQGAINLAAGSKTLAGGGTETWTVSLKYNPTATGLPRRLR